MDIKYLYENTELTIKEIADTLGVPLKRVFKHIEKSYSKKFRLERKRICYRNSKLGDKNPIKAKKGIPVKDIVSDNKGYWMTLKPSWYTGRKRSRHVFKHHVVVCLNLGLTEIPKGWCVHHCDKNPNNNEFSNLVLIKMGDHCKLHQSVLKGATTISKESTLKWVEAHGTLFQRDDIVSSTQECVAALIGE